MGPRSAVECPYLLQLERLLLRERRLCRAPEAATLFRIMVELELAAEAAGAPEESRAAIRSALRRSGPGFVPAADCEAHPLRDSPSPR
ncbi:hypothetical protein [Methylobacterium sp. A54F]